MYIVNVGSVKVESIDCVNITVLIKNVQWISLFPTEIIGRFDFSLKVRVAK